MQSAAAGDGTDELLAPDGGANYWVCDPGWPQLHLLCLHLVGKPIGVNQTVVCRHLVTIKPNKQRISKVYVYCDCLGAVMASAAFV